MFLNMIGVKVFIDVPKFPSLNFVKYFVLSFNAQWFFILGVSSINQCSTGSGKITPRISIRSAIEVILDMKVVYSRIPWGVHSTSASAAIRGVLKYSTSSMVTIPS
jgi:hypothetical protein